jgi:phage terminase small subunit
MRQRERKSAAALSAIAVDSKPDRLRPPASLSDAERTVFVDLVTACDPKHFRPSDLPLLCRYCEATVLAEQAALELRRGAVVDGKPSPWITVQEKAVRAMVSLSMRLHLSPQSRIDPKTLGRKQQHQGPWPWEIRPGREEA